MSDKDDQDWFDLVAGREVADASPSVRREAAVARRALLATQEEGVAAIPSTPDGDANRMKRLADRARREGLLGGRGDSATSSAPKGRGSFGFDWRIGPRTRVAAALVIVLAVGIAVLIPRNGSLIDETTTTRSGMPDLVVKQVPDPATSAKALADALRSAGLQVRTGLAEKFWYVETTVPDNPTPAIVSAFEGFGILGVHSGAWRVMFGRSE